MKTIFTYLILLFACSSFAQDDVSFKLEVPDTVPKGTAFKVTFILENSEGKSFSAPEWTNFTLVSGPQTSSNFSMINGVTSRSLSYTYYIQSEKEGTFTINPASIYVDGKEWKTDWTKVVVKEGYELPREENQFRNPFGSWGEPRFNPSPRIEEKERSKKRTNKKTYRI